MFHLLDMKSIIMFSQIYLLLAVLAQKGLKLKSEEVINFSVYYNPRLLDASYRGLGICRARKEWPSSWFR